ncbi:MAG: hypothetical protein ACREB9_07590 [Thermoplasmata archaeon]
MAGILLTGVLPSRATEVAGVLDRLQYRARADSARRLVDDLRTRGLVPALLSAGERFGAANRALLGR